MIFKEITEDGLYLLTPRSVIRDSSTIYISGDNPNGSFEFGVVDKKGRFIEAPDAILDESFNMRHGYSARVALMVTNYPGSSTQVGISI